MEGPVANPGRGSRTPEPELGDIGRVVNGGETGHPPFRIHSRLSPLAWWMNLGSLLCLLPGLLLCGAALISVSGDSGNENTKIVLYAVLLLANPFFIAGLLVQPLARSRFHLLLAPLGLLYCVFLAYFTVIAYWEVLSTSNPNIRLDTCFWGTLGYSLVTVVVLGLLDLVALLGYMTQRPIVPPPDPAV